MKYGKHPASGRLRRIQAMTLLFWIAILMLPSAGRARQSEVVKRVLLLDWYDRDHPWNARFDAVFKSGLRSNPAATIERYAEYLESTRFPGQNQSQLLHDYLRQKYADRTIDVVVANSDASLDFLMKYRDDLFPDTPIVFIAVKRPATAELMAGPGLTGIVNLNAYKKNLDLALRLHPDTDHVFVVSGTLERDKRFETAAREELQGYESRLQITYLTDFSVDELSAKVRSLPPQSIVLYVWQQSQSAQGKVIESSDIFALIARSAPVPIYGMTVPILGDGLIGGYFNTAEGSATRAAEIVLRILNGERAQEIALERAPAVPMFDWRELRRWGISEDRLPPGSIVQFKESSFWDLYRWQIMGIISLCLVEAFLLSALLIQRSRRELAEARLRESYKHIEDLAGRLIVSQEEERRRISSELHDDLSQKLAALAISVSNLKRQLSTTANPVIEQLDNVQGRVSRIAEDIRRMSHQLRPASLEHIGLGAALKSLIEEYSNIDGAKIGLNVTDLSEPIPHDIALCLYRVAQESLHNIAKHSGAKNAQVGLSIGDEGVSLLVHDDGCGFDPVNSRSRKGLGLVSMEERVRLMEGNFKISASPGVGTRISADFPLRK